MLGESALAHSKRGGARCGVAFEFDLCCLQVFAVIVVSNTMSSFIATPAETVDDFWKTFNEQTSTAQVELTELSLLDLPSFKQKIVDLQSFATESTRILPPYDIKRTQEILNELSKVTQVKEEELKPKKKFSFKNRNKAPVASKPVAEVLIHDTDKKTDVGKSDSKESVDESTCFNVADKTNEEITLTKESIGFVPGNGSIRSLLIKGCKNTTIVARCVLGSVRVEECDNCQIFLGPVSTSIYLDENNSCTMFLASHQLRIHRSINCSLYVRVNSHPIIEDCKGLLFAPYAVQYDALSKHLDEASLTEAKCWDNVVDFRWHRSTQSPNWSILAEEGRVMRKVVREVGANIVDGETTIWGFDKIANAEVEDASNEEKNLSNKNAEENNLVSSDVDEEEM